MTLERPDAAKSPEGDEDEDAALDAALGGLPVPELPAALRKRLEVIPERGNVRHFPVRSWRVSAFGWAAAAAVGLFIGARSIDQEALEAAALETETRERASVEATPIETRASLLGRASADAENETLALAVGAFAELEEEP